ncbi:MAG: 50S ribosomal protein L3 [Candidatus Omnitrophica bacterium]|nr:50S ribosomal protein L3 [Candidatus Omnitrophota bacterium]
MIGLLGKKLGMTHVYDEFGHRWAVTAVQAGPCTVLRLREPKRDGYEAVQVGFEPVDEKRLSKPRLGAFKKAGTGAFRYVREFRLDTAEFKTGQQFTVDLFQQYELVDVAGVSIGKGFQGGVKRWKWKGGPQTHGSMSHRRPGSIGSTTTPGRVWRGHHLPGHMGQDRVTVQNLRILRLDPANHLLLIEGAVPGAENGLVIVTKSKKRPGVIKKPQAIQAVVEEEEEKGKKPAKAAAKK